MRLDGLLIGCTLVIAGCAVATQRPPVPRPDPAQASRLQQLMAQRSQERGGYPVGPGDRLKVKVPNAEDVSGEFVVENDGTIKLPLVGTLPVSGKTDEDVAEDIRQKLATQYLQSPEVIVTVEAYNGRRVSVTGAVGKPGLYDLQGTRETILDMLTRAGGIARDASQTIFFSPADAEAGSRQVAMAEALHVMPAASDSGGRPEQVEIDLSNLYEGRPVPLLMLPVRDGDRIYVRPGGQIFVEGWVDRPSPYDLQPTMTLTQAVTKAGGLHFAASSGSVTLSREDRGGVRRDYHVDYPALEMGQEKDIVLQPGDRVYVGGNPAKVGVWSVYNVFATIVRFSIGGAIALF